MITLPEDFSRPILSTIISIKSLKAFCQSRKVAPPILDLSMTKEALS